MKKLRTYHYTRTVTSHKDTDKKKRPTGGFFSLPEPKKEPPVPKIYFELEELLHKTACEKTRKVLPRGNTLKRAVVLRSVHKGMAHPDDLRKIISYYAKNDIVSKAGKPLVIFKPAMLKEPAVIGWILSSMADNGRRDVHYLNSDTPKATGPNSGCGDMILSDEEILYTDEDSDVEVDRIGLLVRIREGKHIKNANLKNPKTRVLYQNTSKGVCIEQRRRQLVVLIKGREVLFRDLSQDAEQ